MFTKACLLIGIVTFMITGCSLPKLKERTNSTYPTFESTKDTRLGQKLPDVLLQHPDESGFYMLKDSMEAFSSRLLLIAAADKSIDIQYYIWRKDLTGLLLLQSLYEAAERGVQVRLLLDDHGTKGLDNWLILLHKHPNIEVRLFNPFPWRFFKLSRFVWDFNLANRRMHNKSLISDNLAAIVGGRNIGDEYFGATDGVLFNDADVLTIGPVVEDTSKDFDIYWHSVHSYPLDQIVNMKKKIDDNYIENSIAKNSNNEKKEQYIKALEESELIKRIMAGEDIFTWSYIELLSDNPNTLAEKREYKNSILHQFESTIGDPKLNLEIISPYFVPGKSGTKSILNMQKDGVKIRILTNSREATDVSAVHTGYARYRKELLNADIELYEMQRDVNDTTRERAGIFGSSGGSLHAKIFATDEKRVFVGSFNFDPRSAHLNTEMGYIIHNTQLAKEIGTIFQSEIPLTSYKPALNEKGELIWILPDGSITTKEPGSNFFGNIYLWFLSILPIEWML